MRVVEWKFEVDGVAMLQDPENIGAEL